jgi:hypothetical protein
MDFCNTLVFSMKKVDNSANFAAGRIISRRTNHNSLCKDKNKTMWPVTWQDLQDNDQVTLPHMHKLFLAPTLVA